MNRSMTNLPFDPQTLDFYAAEAPVYTASGKHGASRHLHAFLDLLRPGARILELGCGGGHDCASMLARGYFVDPTDGVPEMAAKAEKRTKIPVKVMRFDELRATCEYDAVWAQASLLHVPRDNLSAVLARIWEALRPGGLHFASYKAGGVEGRDRFNRYFNYLTLEQAERAYALSGNWEFVSADHYEGGGYEGSKGPWIALMVRRPIT